jgi:site-specific DNA-methyltransferase (adenine-specific)
MNRLYYGDNLIILREHIGDESIDLIYLDPPFNSKRGYNLLFKTPKGHKSSAQVTAFEDTWHWGEQAEREFAELLHQSNTDVAEVVAALRRFLKENDMMAYLVMMANRLVELYRVLKPTGSLYLHCDQTTSHYLKIVLDAIFNPLQFRNEIIWQRTSAGKPVYRNIPKNADSIFWYSKTNAYKFKPVLQPLSEDDIATFNLDDHDGRGPYNTQPIINPAFRPNLRYVYRDMEGREWQPPKNGWRFSEERMKALEKDGRLYFTKTTIREKYYLSERLAKGKQVSNIWTDISPVTRSESLGYPTQKPLALLERIVESGSEPGEMVLDPFCGCGTAVHAAQKLGRQWAGIDITHLAIGLIERRMKVAFPGLTYEVHGTPRDLDGARDLAMRSKYEFQWWACALVSAQPYQGRKKGADTGIDGLIYFQDDVKGTAKKIIVSVKGGENVGVGMVRDLIATVERESAQIGLFVTLAEPTKPMVTEAVSAGFYQSPHGGAYPRIQILTVEGLLSGKQRPNYPDFSMGTLSFKKAKVEESQGEQARFL